jgi:hypothetical protein
VTAPYVKPTISAVEAGRRANASPGWAMSIFQQVPIDPTIEFVGPDGKRLNPRVVATAKFEEYFAAEFPWLVLTPAHVQKP